MKVFLMHPDRDFDLTPSISSYTQALIQDLELNTLLSGMANDDQFLLDIAWKALFSSFKNDMETILYRQEILKDCLYNQQVIREMYTLAVETIERKRKNWFGIFGFNYPSSVLYSSIDLLKMFTDMLKKLRDIAEEQACRFQSKGFTTLFSTLVTELNDDYFTKIRNHLTELKFHYGTHLSAELGKGNESTNLILHENKKKKPGWINQLFRKGSKAYTFRINPRDEAGARILAEIKDRGINHVANALAQSVDHILHFFEMFQTELAFYVGCLNLYEKLNQLCLPIAIPLPETVGSRRLCFSEMYDICLALTLEQRVVSNSVDATQKNLVIITGANQGGKSSFLRGIGAAQLMMQCGMFVAAESFSADLCSGLFTHYKREEDETMERGKLDEELSRFSAMVDSIPPNSLVLFNESFASTNEREGSEIARQIVSALLEKRIKVFFVTHLYEFAHGFFGKSSTGALSLRAERKLDGTRTFKLIEAKPLKTSFGVDLYEKIFSLDSKEATAG